jgi:hypothetical protein
MRSCSAAGDACATGSQERIRWHAYARPMTDEEHARALTLLEGRRLAIDASMWQAPTLTLVAQAFLLEVLTDDKVGWVVGAFVALAGVLACSAAIVALWLLRDREVAFSKRITLHTDALNLEELARTPPPDRSTRSPLEWKGYIIWTVVLAAFIVADVVALFVTRC